MLLGQTMKEKYQRIIKMYMPLMIFKKWEIKLAIFIRPLGLRVYIQIMKG